MCFLLCVDENGTDGNCALGGESADGGSAYKRCNGGRDRAGHHSTALR